MEEHHVDVEREEELLHYSQGEGVPPRNEERR